MAILGQGAGAKVQSGQSDIGFQTDREARTFNQIQTYLAGRLPDHLDQVQRTFFWLVDRATATTTAQVSLQTTHIFDMLPKPPIIIEI